MHKFIVLCVVALVASVSGAPGGLVAPFVASPPAVAVHVGTSYANTYRAPVVKAIPVVKEVPVVKAVPVVNAGHQVIAAAPVIVAHPILKTTHQVVAHPVPTIVKTAPLVAHAPIAVAHAPLVHAAPIASIHGLSVTGYADHYKAAPLVKTGIVTAPVALVR